MSALLERIDQAVSVTKVSRSAKELIEQLSDGSQDHFVVMRNNKPEAVLLGVESYQNMIDELDDLRIESLALERLSQPDTRAPISHDDMLARFGVTRSDDENVED